MLIFPNEINKLPRLRSGVNVECVFTLMGITFDSTKSGTALARRGADGVDDIDDPVSGTDDPASGQIGPDHPD